MYPKIENQTEKLRELCENELKNKYENSDGLKERLNYEISIINKTNTEFIFLYLNKAFKDLDVKPYQTMPRGLIGNSLVAYLCNITNIDPVKFNLSEYAVFGTTNHYKEPDVDINVASNELRDNLYQKISSYDEVYKIADAMCKNNNGGLYKFLGGKFLIPQNDAYSKSDYDSIVNKINNNDCHDVKGLYRLDLLLNNQILIFNELVNIIGINPESIDINNANVTEYLNNNDYKDIYKNVPEFDHDLVVEISNKVKPKNFDDLVKVTSMAHGTNAWKDNAETLINNGTSNLSEIVSNRDDLFDILVNHNVSKNEAYEIMEDVRKGKGISKCSKYYDYELLLKSGIPEWLIDSCNKIKYLFPRAHAISYTLLAWKLIWFKIHYKKDYDRIISNYYKK